MCQLPCRVGVEVLGPVTDAALVVASVTVTVLRLVAVSVAEEEARWEPPVMSELMARVLV